MITDRDVVAHVGRLLGRAIGAAVGIIVCAWIWPIDQTVMRVKERRRG